MSIILSPAGNPKNKEAEGKVKELLKAASDKAKWNTVWSVEAGEVIPEEKLHNSLICQDVLNRASKKFDAPARGILILPTSVALRNIQFEIGSAKLTASSSRQLNEVVKMMSKNPNMKLIIEGHTDDLAVTKPLFISSGVFCTDNQCLSEKRAESVQSYLINNGINDERLTVEGYGDTKPYAPLDREKNRRVPFRMK
ncbi:MAG: OmpA family protein [Desulfobacterales bacterium]|nr:OmpA family protein [Desulfobacterales bacterium]